VGKTLKEIDLRHRTGATMTLVVRDSNLEINPGPEFRLEAEDILVLLGQPEQLARAANYLHEGKVSSGGAMGKLKLTPASPATPETHAGVETSNY
jgi:uncharacterized protein with PhoU and TrkA domain